MRIIFTIACLFLVQYLLLAQPANDECETAINLGVAPYCEPVHYTNVGATPSNIGANNIPPCWDAGTVQRDVWFSFIASDTILDYSISVIGEAFMGSNPLKNPQVAVYRGSCSPGNLFFFGCFQGQPGSDFLKFSLSGLTPGATYFLRIADYPEAGTNAGTFKLCIEPKSPITNIIEGFSKDCEGILVDSGGPDGNYGPNENFTFTICPEVPSQCIELIFTYYHLDFNQDVITIYDGPTTNSPLIGTIVGGQGAFTESNGGVCRRFTAASGCMTIRFTSNAINQYEGFLAEWKCLPIPCFQYTQPQIQSSFTEQEVLQNLSSTQAVITFDKLTCGDGASGLFFNGHLTDLGLTKGILLSTGSAQLALGPNNTGSAGISLGMPGDPDLDILSGLTGTPIQSFDACVLELEVFANTDEITFEYVFGSEEYPEFAGPTSNFNDIFAFFISGPGITGIPQLGNQANMAVLPDGTPVQINSLNYQENWEYYRDNTGGVSLQYDGLTSDYLGVKKSLTARHSVTPCQTYKLKLAIADRGDGVYDSGVFISEIKGGAPSLALNFNNGIDYLVKGCTSFEDQVLIQLNAASDNVVSFKVDISGSAVLGEDYELNIPPVITFQPGETSLQFPIIPLSGGPPKGDQTIIITLSNNFGCGDVVFSELTIILRDNLKISVNGGLDTAFFCPGNEVPLTAEGANEYFWEPSGIFNDPTGASVIGSPTGSMWVEVTGQLGVCVASDSVFLQEVNPQVNIANSAPVQICRGKPVTLVAQNNLSGQGSIQWTPTTGLNNPSGSVTSANPNFTTTYTVTATLTGCVVTDTITVFVDPFDFPIVVKDLSLCEGNSIKLANDIFFTNTTYTWTPATYLSGTTVSGPISTPEETITYKLVAQGPSGVCKDSAEVTITVIPAALEILAPDTTFLCAGDTTFIGSSFTAGGIVTWKPVDSTLLVQQGSQAIIVAKKSFWAVAEMNVGPCKVVDSVFIRVDSLPDLSIRALPEREVYCQGDIVSLISWGYLNQDFPDIGHRWIPNSGDFLTPDSNLNIVITALQTKTFTRITENNACSSIDTFHMRVIPSAISLSDNNINLCPGDQYQVFVLDENLEDLTWMPPTGLSCTNCPDPIITAGQSSQAYSITATEDGCAKQGQLLVSVELPVLNLQDIVLCVGEATDLNPGAQQGVQYYWESSDPTFGTSNVPNPNVMPLANAMYFVTATLGECEVTGELSVAVIQDAQVTISADMLSICRNEQVTLTAAGLPIGGTYVWSPGGQTSPSITVSPPISTTYSVQYSTVKDCFQAEAEWTITVESPLEIELEVTPEQDTFIVGEPLTVRAIVADVPPGSTFTWRVNGNVVSGATGSILETTATDPPMKVEVTITTPAGCDYVAEVDIFVIIPTYALPNVFTPNGDGLNDYFTVVMDRGITILDFRVFSRWGQVVYNNESPDQGWDGTFKDKPSPSDTYAYIITIEYPDGRRETMRGDITLVR